MYRFRPSGLRGKFDDLVKVGAALVPTGGSGDPGSSYASGATTAALDYIYSKEQERVQRLMDHSDEVVVKVGRTVDWTRWAIGALAVGGTVLLLRRALARPRS